MDLKNKKRLYLTALGLTGTLSLAGCGYGNQLSKTEKNKLFNKYANTSHIDYTNASEQDKEVSIPYEVVANLWVSFISNTDDVYITVHDDNDYRFSNTYEYFSGVLLSSYYYNKEEPIIPVDYSISYFIEKYGFLKESYTDNDLKKLLELIRNDYEINLRKGYNGNSCGSYNLVLKKERKK